MDAQLKQKWLDALRSGEYQQGTGFFHNEETGAFCCLGVLCVAADQPHTVRLSGNWWFADETLGRAPNGGCWVDRLASMNDGGQSFAFLADYIEHNVPADGSRTEPASGDQP